MKGMRFWLVLGLVAAASACGSSEDSTPATAEPDVTADSDVPTSDVPSTTRPAPTTNATPLEPTTLPEPPPSTVPSPVPSTSDVAGEVDVKVYFLSGERLAIAHRLVAGPELLRQAIGELLAGPTLDERSTGLLSTVPPETELLDVNLADGVATIDLSSAYASGGGTLSMMARLAQVVFTATQFDTVDSVAFRLDGEPIETLGGEGLMLDGPQARMDIDRSISGSVIIDTPVVGATVTSPFTVTGEGDVFEAQFPIEVWAGGWGIGELIGGIAPVTAGAWGDWSDFEVTITLDAPAGPIELVAYDEGGCGTGPDCPEIIRTVVPLIFTG